MPVASATATTVPSWFSADAVAFAIGTNAYRAGGSRSAMVDQTGTSAALLVPAANRPSPEMRLAVS